MPASKTTAEIVRFAGGLEEDSARFYEALAARFPDKADAFSGWARDSRKSAQFIQRTYQETISDALEACFAFEGLDPQALAIQPPDGAGAWPESIAQAARLEDEASRLYSTLAACSQSLLGTIADAFRSVSERRARRKAQLEALLG